MLSFLERVKRRLPNGRDDQPPASEENNEEPKEEENPQNEGPYDGEPQPPIPQPEAAAKEEAIAEEPQPLIEEPNPPQQPEAETKDEEASDAMSIVPDEPEPSKPRNDLYIQMRQSFRHTTKEAFIMDELMAEMPPIVSAEMHFRRSIGIAVSIQKVFHSIALILEGWVVLITYNISGFLSGLAAFHTIIAFAVDDAKVFAQKYSQISAPLQSIFYLCFVINSIDSMDRFEVGETFRETLKRLIALQKGGLATMIALFGSLLSIVMSRFEEGFLEAGDHLEIWKWMSFGRAVCAIAGWLLLALQPDANFTRDQLISFISAEGSEPSASRLPNAQIQLDSASQEMRAAAVNPL